MTPMIVVLISIISSSFLFKPFLLTRATFSDQSTIDRKFFDQVGLKMAEKNPLFGVGLGESVLHMEQYSGKSLKPWNKQPPHNYFIIAAAELGIPGALILFWIFAAHFLKLFKNLKLKIKNSDYSYYLLLTTILCSFLLLMQFDHYFYTLEQTQLLLWVILALIASESYAVNQ
jgi:O-antigen ligase